MDDEAVHCLLTSPPCLWLESQHRLDLTASDRGTVGQRESANLAFLLGSQWPQQGTGAIICWWLPFLCFNSPEILSQLLESNYAMTVAIKMWRKRKAIIRFHMHFRLVIDCAFLLEGERSGFFERAPKASLCTLSTSSMHHYYKWWSGSLWSHHPQWDVFGLIYCSPDPVIFFSRVGMKFVL